VKLVKAFSACLLVSLTSLPSLALAEIVVIVSAGSSVSSLDKSDVARIFLGRANTFPNGDRVVPINQAEDGAVRTEFDLTLLGKSQAQMKAYWAKQSFSGRATPPDEVNGDSDVVAAVGSDPALIGYVDSSAVTGAVKVVYTVE
jgi:ABC-type phosphate transport system substrate-binding protein